MTWLLKQEMQSVRKEANFILGPKSNSHPRRPKSASHHVHSVARQLFAEMPQRMPRALPPLPRALPPLRGIEVDAELPLPSALPHLLFLALLRAGTRVRLGRLAELAAAASPPPCVPSRASACATTFAITRRSS